MAEEIEENIKVVVRVRDLIPREKGQKKVHEFPKYYHVSILHFAGIHGGGRDTDYSEIHGQNLELWPRLQSCGGQQVKRALILPMIS